MSRFLSKLSLENADNTDDGKWFITSPLVYQSDLAMQAFTVPVGFPTDLASVPRIPIIFDALGATANAPAALHDYLYTSHLTTRSMADAILREASASVGIPAWRSWMMWSGVRVFGSKYW
jgi:hypothetical protein